MGFTLHFLRPNDLFFDIGANIGSYTVLASGVIDSFSLTFEPVPKTFTHLKDNININHIEHKVKLFNIALGDLSGKLKFTSELDTVNHVLSNNEQNIINVEVPVELLITIVTKLFLL